ncbi:MAG: hypothetical protein ACE14M_00760 [Terriglobales bacterium]
MAKVFTIPVVPNPKKSKRNRSEDRRYVEGQRILAKAIRYLTQSDVKGNRAAIELLSEHFRTRFRMSDRP